MITDRRCHRWRRPATLWLTVLLVMAVPRPGVTHAQDVRITEFVAVNDTGLTDSDGDQPDWVEIQNMEGAPVNLGGWYLTDNESDLRKWQFPALELEPGGFVVVFASDKDRVPPDDLPDGEIHTSFKLSGDGEYLALVRPDGVTVAHEYSPAYPGQFEDVSYGITQEVDVADFVGEKTGARYLVPTDASLGVTWTELGFDDASWTGAAASVGYDLESRGNPPPGQESNLALGGTATQSSTALEGEASRAIDGNTDGVFGAGSSMHTENEPENWWQVDLGEDFPLERVVLWNRTDCCDERLTNFRVTVTDSAGGVTFQEDYFPDLSSPFDQDFAVVLPDGTRGRVVRVEKLGPDRNGDYWFSLAEVEVFRGSPGYGPIIETDLEASLFEKSAGVYLRLPFTADAPEAIEVLELRMKYDDGFTAYLNGREVARRNAPDTPAWNSAATAQHPDEEAFVFESINLTSHLDALRTGPNILAIHGLNIDLADDDFLLIPELSGSTIRSGDVRYFLEPSPGETNPPTGVVGFVADTRFSRDRGFFQAPVEVAITTDTPDATVRYTTDGSAPTEENGVTYTGPIEIATTTTLRAAAFKAEHGPTDVDTHTYIFAADVVGQVGTGFPFSWGSANADYAMDPDVVDDPAYRDTVVNDITTTIPTLSLVMDVDDLFGPLGIYSNTAGRGQAWEKPCSMEMIYPEDWVGGTERQDEQLDCGIRIFGFGSRPHAATLKHSLRLIFRRTYGAGKLRFRFFNDFDIEEIDDIVLRAQGSRGWNDSSPAIQQTQYIRDAWSRYTERDMGKLTTSSTYVNLYLNGLYWGLYNPVERPTAEFMEAHLGGEVEDYDALNARVGSIEVVDGSREDWDTLVALARASPNTLEDFQAIEQFLDVDDLADYMLVNFYTGNRDWSGANGNNMRVAGAPEPAGGYRSFCWDMEYSIWDAGDNVLSVITAHDSPATIHAFLRNNPEYRLRFADRVHKHFSDGGALSPEETARRWLDRASEINGAIVGESARWGDRRREVPYTRDVEWLREQDRLLTTYFPLRTDILFDQLEQARLVTELEPPELNVAGGPVESGFVLSLKAPNGDIFYTVDGSDPRTPGGEIAPDAIPFDTGETTVIVPAGAAVRTLVPVDGSLGLDWTAVDFPDAAWAAGATGVGFEQSSGYEDLIAADVGDAMFQINASVYMRIPFTVENPSADFLILRMKYDDGFVAYINGRRVAAANAPEEPSWDSTATDSNSDALAVEFEDFDLSGQANLLQAGVNVLAIHGLNRSTTNGDMLTLPQLEVASPPPIGDPRILTTTSHVKSRALQGDTWSALEEAVFLIPGLRITELNYHPHAPQPGINIDADDFEFVELANVGDESIALEGACLSGAVTFCFETPTASLGPGEVVVVVKDFDAFEARYGTSGIRIAGEYSGNLSNGSEEVTLRGSLGEEILRFTYRDVWYPETDGDGPSLVIVDAAGAPEGWGEAASWRPSDVVGGTPGVHVAAPGPAGGQWIGDTNQDAGVDIVDVVSLAQFIFAGGDAVVLPCGDGTLDDPSNLALLDVKPDGSLDVLDPIYMLDYLFRDGEPPALGAGCIPLPLCPDICSP